MSNLRPFLQLLHDPRAPHARESSLTGPVLTVLDEIILPVSGGRLGVSLPRAQAAGCGEREIQELQAFVDRGNKVLSRLGVRTEAQLQTLLTEESVARADTTSAASARSSRGYSVRVRFKAWGFIVTLSHAFVADMDDRVAHMIDMLERCGVDESIRELLAEILTPIVGVIQNTDDGDGVAIKFVWPGIPFAVVPQ